MHLSSLSNLCCPGNTNGSHINCAFAQFFGCSLNGIRTILFTDQRCFSEFISLHGQELFTIPIRCNYDIEIYIG